MTEQNTIQQDIETATRILKESGAQEVFVFGSASRGVERPVSDIDLAVRGIAPEIFFEVMSRVAFAISRPLDLIDLDDQSPFGDYLEKKGELKRVA